MIRCLHSAALRHDGFVHLFLTTTRTEIWEVEAVLRSHSLHTDLVSILGRIKDA